MRATTRTLTPWMLRAVWATLPVTAGGAAAAAFRPWEAAPRATAEVLLWAAWAAVLVAVLVPRPVSLTAIRAGAPTAFAVTVLVVWSGRPPTREAVLAVCATALSVVLAALPATGQVCAQGAAYGDEERFPLKVPPALFLGLLPLAVGLVGAGIATGPLLLAAGAVLPGVLAVLAGFPVAVLLFRSLHLLSRRWVVLVPAGLVVADPMTLADPVLFTREHVRALALLGARDALPPSVFDARLGALLRSVLLVADDDVDLGVRARRATSLVRRRGIAFAPVMPRVVLERAAARRLPVQRSATASTSTG